MRKHRFRSLTAGLCALLLILTCIGCDTTENTPSEPAGSAVSTDRIPTEDTTTDTTTDTSAVTTTDTTTVTESSREVPTTTTNTTSSSNTTTASATGSEQSNGKTINRVTLGSNRHTAATTLPTGSTTATTKQPTSAATTSPQQTVQKGTLTLADYIPNAAAWQFAGFPNQKNFAMELQFIGYDPYNRVLVENSMKNLKLGDTIRDFEINVRTFEWTTNTVINDLHAIKPASRQEALDLVMKWYGEETKGKQHPWGDMQSFTRWQHYAGEAGYDYLGCEIGASVNCYNLSVAFTRGAAKQFNKASGNGNVSAWFVDFSQWAPGGMINYAEDLNPNMYRTQDGYHNNVSSTALSGQSPNTTRRAYYMSYMAGTNWLVSEAGGESAYYPETDTDGNYKLSPHGAIFQDFYKFAQRNADRGVCYTPFAVVVNRDHGLPYGHWMEQQKVFNALEQTEGDKMIDSLIQMIYTDNNYPRRSKNQTKEQCTTPYGDTFDFLTQTAAQNVLNSYPVLILAGDIKFSAQEVTRYTEYVKQGGILVMNSVYKSYFPAFDKSKNHGKGRVIVYGNDYDLSQLDGILSDLVTELLPVKVKGDVQYLVNIKNGGVVVTLINNHGVSKVDLEETAYDESCAEAVTVTYTGNKKVLALNNWMTTQVMEGDTTYSVTLSPGGIDVIEFVV